MPTEKDLDRALHNALESDPDFLVWFIAHLAAGAEYTTFVSCRSDHPWGKIRAVLPDPVTGALRAEIREAESDLLLVLENKGRARLGVHIENKRHGGSFTDNQPELYAARAEAWRRSEQHGNYNEWETVLVAPDAFISKHGDQSKKFISRITYEQLAEKLPVFRPPDAA